MRRERDRVAVDPEYFLGDKVRLLAEADLYLELFNAIYIDDDESRAVALAPRLNQCIPESMTRCPMKELRPKPKQLDPT